MKRFGIFFFLVVMMTSLLYAQLPAELKTKFPVQKGNLYMSESYLNFNYLKDTEERADTMLVYNAWDKPMEINAEKPPKYLNIEVQPQTLPAGETGLIIVTYSGIKRGEYGYVRYNLGLRTNDESVLMKTFPVNAYIEEDFSKLSEEEMENAPVIEIPETNYDFGKVKSGDIVSHKFLIRNNGKRDLIIRSTKASCGCTASEPEKSVLAPGEETYVGIKFDTSGRTGKQHKTVSIFSNDPRYNTAVLHIQGYIE